MQESTTGDHRARAAGAASEQAAETAAACDAALGFQSGRWEGYWQRRSGPREWARLELTFSQGTVYGGGGGGDDAFTVDGHYDPTGGAFTATVSPARWGGGGRIHLSGHGAVDGATAVLWGVSGVEGAHWTSAGGSFCLWPSAAAEGDGPEVRSKVDTARATHP